MGRKKSKFSGELILREPIGKNLRVTELVDKFFQTYNAGRLKDACKLFAEKMLDDNVTVGLSLSGALTPAGLGGSCVVPLIKAGFVDWIVSTGANLYHDVHFSIGFKLHRGSPFTDDRTLRKEGVVRIYDIFFEQDVLLSTDRFFREIMKRPEFQREMGTAEFHYLLGKYVYEAERRFGVKSMSLLSAAYKYGVPVYTSSPGDSSIGMNLSALALNGYGLKIDISKDVNETTAIVLSAKRGGGKSGLIIFGGGSPKNFMLQTEPQIQEILGIDESGHDYFIQITDARPDTGGLSGATPSEAVSWGKIAPDELPNTVVCYTDSTIAMPILTSYVLAKRKPRKHKRLYFKRGKMLSDLKRAHMDAIKKGKVKI